MNRWQASNHDVIALVRKGLEGVTTKAEAARIMGDQPHLVPVRLGGPWHGPRPDGVWDKGARWEKWKDGEYQSNCAGGPYRLYGGEVQYHSNGGYWSGCSDTDPEGAELRASKDWTGDLPEGTRLATDLIVGQRVRTLHMTVQLTGRVVGVNGNGSVLVTWDKLDNDSCEFAGSLEGY